MIYVFQFYLFCGHYLITAVIAIFWTLAFELPLIVIEKYLIGSNNKIAKGELTEYNLFYYAPHFYHFSGKPSDSQSVEVATRQNVTEKVTTGNVFGNSVETIRL